MLTGTIKFFNKSKGFGFITADAGGKEVFLPSATVIASGIKKVEPGLRVSYEEEPDVKGPKAIALQALDEPRRVVEEPKRPVPQPQRAAPMTLYYDPASRAAEVVQGALTTQDVEVALVDYTVTPPAPEELKKWSLAVSSAGLVRRSDAMFFALDLDDRFISESDFWLAVSQHPTLINGPILKAGNKLDVCKNAEDVRRFLGVETTAVAAPKPKVLSARLSALIRGEALPDEPDDDEDDDIEDVDAVEVAAVEIDDAEDFEVAPEPEIEPQPDAKRTRAKAGVKEKPAKAKLTVKKPDIDKPKAAKTAAAAKKPAAKAKR